MVDSVEIGEKVTAVEGRITLPTYALKAENRNPVFRSQYGVAHIYPYTLLDDIEARPTEKSYRTLVLENRYLRVTVIPDLGGRVYSVFDKTSQREVFYKNSVIKFSPLAIRGAFFSGGVEFSFPVAHAPTTTDPVNWEIRENEDGSASVSFGGIEHISRLRWTITLTLYPNRCALAQDVQLYNPTSIPGRYHYWTNASVDADDQLEFIYPLRRVRSYEFAGTASWPAARLDLILNDPGLPGMEGVPMWPADRLRGPVNFRWQKNMLAQVSIFGRDVKWDFFGAWRHSVNHGYAHFAKYRDVSGMKLWSWGNAPVGVVNQTALMDDGSLYAETQCGAMETQLDFDFLQPGKTRAWREWWVPLRGLGGLTCASAEMGARIQLSPGEKEGEVRLLLGLCPVYPVEKADVQVSVPGKILLEQSISLSPEQAWLYQQPLQAKDLAGHPLNLMVIDSDGRLILNYTHERDASPVEPHQPAVKTAPESAGDFYQLGLKHENFDNREQALAAYQEALARDPELEPAPYRLGLMLLRAADFTGARQRLEKAASLGNQEANYYLGILALLTDQLETAEKSFLSVPAGNPIFSAALQGQGRVCLARKEWRKAVDYFSLARKEADNEIDASLLLAIALQRAGREAEALQELRRLLATDPLSHPALYELAKSTSKEGEQAQAHLKRMRSDDRQYVLDLACFYIDAGLPQDALSILEGAWPEWNYAMVAYLAGTLCQKSGRADEAVSWLQKAASASMEYVFPSRLEEVLALQYALEQNPQDHKAMYYLGNFLYAHERYAEGVQHWKEAVKGLDEFDILYRNLGLAAWQRDKNYPGAVEYFEKALQLNPQNQDLYLHLDDLYKLQGLTEKREGLLAKIKGLPEAREDVHKRGIVMLVELGHFQEALDILQKEKFVPLEMDQSFHNTYVQALLQRAEAHLKAERTEEAISDYQKALEFPENLGVGAPTTLAQANIHYLLGLAYEKLGRFHEALAAWRCAAGEHHPHGSELYPFVQMSLDKLSRYSELGFE